MGANEFVDDEFDCFYTRHKFVFGCASASLVNMTLETHIEARMSETIACFTHGHLRANNEQRWRAFEQATLQGMNRIEAMEKYCPGLPPCCVKMFLLKFEDSALRSQLYYACNDRVKAIPSNMKFTPTPELED